MPTALVNATGTDAGTWQRLVEAAFDRSVEYALRDQPLWRTMIDKRPVAQAMPGSSVTLTIHKDLANLATTPLTENVDPDAVAYQAPDRVTVTLNEYGNSTLTVEKLGALSFTKPESEKVEILARNQADTFDQLVRTVADGGTRLLTREGGVNKTAGTAVNSITAADTLNRDTAALAVALLRKAKVAPKMGDQYLALAHSDVLYDLMRENSATAWIAPHIYGGDSGPIRTAEVGSFMGATYYRTLRTTQVTNTVPTQVYSTYYFGKQAMVEAVAIEPHTVVGNQTDKLKRFYPLGWYGLLGWSLYRPEALRVVKTASSIASLT